MLHYLTSWKQRLTSAKCQNYIGTAPDNVTYFHPSDLLQNKSRVFFIAYIGGGVRIFIHICSKDFFSHVMANIF